VKSGRAKETAADATLDQRRMRRAPTRSIKAERTAKETAPTSRKAD
jgi:hypothetical protein